MPDPLPWSERLRRRNGLTPAEPFAEQPQAVGRTVHVEIDPNVRVRGNLTFSTLDDADGPLTVGLDVLAVEPESGLRGPAKVAAIEGEFVYLEVPWGQLREPDDPEPRCDLTDLPTTMCHHCQET